MCGNAELHTKMIVNTNMNNVFVVVVQCTWLWLCDII